MNISLILDWTEKVRRRGLIGNAVNGRHGREEETEEEKEMVVEELGATAVERKRVAMEEEKECERVLRTVFVKMCE